MTCRPTSVFISLIRFCLHNSARIRPPLYIYIYRVYIYIYIYIYYIYIYTYSVCVCIYIYIYSRTYTCRQVRNKIRLSKPIRRRSMLFWAVRGANPSQSSILALRKALRGEHPSGGGGGGYIRQGFISELFFHFVLKV